MGYLSTVTPVLSLCIATRNRAHLLPQTLASIDSQLSDDVELVFIDGGSSDDTEAVVREFSETGRRVQYKYYDDNAGLDRDYDRAVCLANGTFCWLLTDDDLLDPDSLARVLSALESDTNLLVLNARVASSDFQVTLQETRILAHGNAKRISQIDDLFLETVGDTLSFIGAVVIRREVWLSRDRQSFYGSMFVHVGVILQQPPMSGVKIVTEPVMTLRYGNASWSDRTFEIWTIRWPELIWQFTNFSEQAKASVVDHKPFHSMVYLLKQRARGAYGLRHYRLYVASQTQGVSRARAWLVAIAPGAIVNVCAILYVGFLGRGGKLGLYDLRNSVYASSVSQWLLSFLRN